MAEPLPSRRVRRIQRLGLTLVVAGGLVNYIDRASLSVGLPYIRRDLGLSLEAAGVLSSAFLVAYALSQLPAGALIDRLGARLMLTVGLGLWSLAEILGGVVGSFWQFIGARLLLGAGESPQFPSCARVVADWFHPRERGWATGIWNCSSTLGTAISMPLLTALMLLLGWRWMFIVMGLAGLCLAGLIYLLHRDPRHIALTSDEKAHLDGDGGAATRLSGSAWLRLFSYRTVWGMLIPYAAAMYCLWIYTAWMPQYLEIQFHVTVARSGWLSSIPFVCGAGGSLATGRVCDWLFRRGFSSVASCKFPMIVCLLGIALFTGLTARATSSAFAICTVSASVFLLYGAACAAWTMPTAVAPTGCAASVASIQNFFGYLSAALAPAVTGFIAAHTGSFQPAMAVGAGLALAGAIVHAALVKGPLPISPLPLGPAPLIAPGE